MSSVDLGQGFPDIQSRFVDQNGMIQQTWLQLLVALWNRTGQGQGTSPEDGIIAAILADASLPSGGGGEVQLDLFSDAPAQAAAVDFGPSLLLSDPPRCEPSDAIMLAVLMADSGGSRGSSGSVNSVVSATSQLHAVPSTGDVVLSLDIGTSGSVIPLLDGANVWSNSQTITGSLNVSGGVSANIMAANGANFTVLSVVNETVSGSITVSGSGSIGGSLNVTNGISANTMAANGANFTVLTVVNETISGSLSVGGSVNVTGGVAATTGAFVGLNTTNFTVTNETVSGAFVAQSGSFATNVTVSGSQTVSGSVNVSGGVSASTGAFTGLNATNETATNVTISGSLVCSSGSNAAIDALAVTTLLAPATDNSIPCGIAPRRWTDIWAVSGSVNPSDIRLKTAIERVPGEACLSIVRETQPITWRWDHKDWAKDGRVHWGFNAQALQGTIARYTSLDCAAILVDDEGHYNLRPHELLPILWQAVRELALEKTR